MQVSEIMIANAVTVSPEDTAAKALSLMIENKIHQLPVVEKDSLLGMIYAKRFIGASFFPETTKVKNFVVRTPSVNSNVEIGEVNEIIIKSGLRALPVMSKNKFVGIISETDLVLNQDLGTMLVDDVMRGAIVIPGDSSLSNALSKMKKQNISRLPVIDRDGKLMGSMDTLDIAGVLRVPKERKSGSRTTKLSSGTERIDVRNVSVKEIMHDVTPVALGTRLAHAVRVLKMAEEIIVTHKDLPIGIITPKDIIKRLIPAHGRSMIHISHINDQSAKTEIVTEISKFLKRVNSRFDRIYSVEVAVDRHKNRKYSMHGKMMTTRGLVTAKSVGWDVRIVARELMNRLDRRGTSHKIVRRESPNVE
ncbi:MAG: CBS domain-containing protein [Nitrososphaerales archaeon]